MIKRLICSIKGCKPDIENPFYRIFEDGTYRMKDITYFNCKRCDNILNIEGKIVEIGKDGIANV